MSILTWSAGIICLLCAYYMFKSIAILLYIGKNHHNLDEPTGNFAMDFATRKLTIRVGWLAIGGVLSFIVWIVSFFI